MCAVSWFKHICGDLGFPLNRKKCDFRLNVDILKAEYEPGSSLAGTPIPADLEYTISQIERVCIDFQEDIFVLHYVSDCSGCITMCDLLVERGDEAIQRSMREIEETGDRYAEYHGNIG
jgi:hypothetical protein